MADDDGGGGDLSGVGADYRLLHERFVSNHNGTTPQEVVLATSAYNLSILLFSLLSQIVDFGQPGSVRNTLLEFPVLVLPTVFCFTCCSDLLIPFESLLLVACGLALFAGYGKKGGKFKSSDAGKKRTQLGELVIANARNLPFLTNFRSGVLLSTSVAILAVDFRVFPRRFAKTETFGYGLMDVGVGAFVFMAGIVSQEARKAAETTTFRSRLVSLRKSCLESVPMLFLWLVRLVSVKSSGYHEHVTEYGVHWNFFLTLAMVKLACALTFVLLPARWSWHASLLVSLAHESVLLMGLDWAHWTLDPATTRSGDHLVAANREGIVSLPGYVAIYLAGVSWGCRLVGGDANEADKFTFDGAVREAKNMGMWTAVMWASLFYSTEDLFSPPSRRLANWGYYNWTVASSLTCMLSLLICDLVATYTLESSAGKGRTGSSSQSKAVPKNKGTRRSKRPLQPQPTAHSPPPPSTEETPATTTPERWLPPHYRSRVPVAALAVSSNGLAYFLLANALTGLVNLSVATMDFSGCPAVIVVALYMLTLHLTFVAAFARGIKLKAW